MAHPKTGSFDPIFRRNTIGLFVEEKPPADQPTLQADELFLKQAIDTDADKGIELLYRRYFQPLCSHAIKYVGSKSVAEDLVSEVFYDFYRTGTYLTITSSYRFYLFRSVRNRAFTHLKSNLRKQEVVENHYYQTSRFSESPEAISQFEELYQDVQNALNALPVSRRKIYMMNRFEGKKYKEIADELNLSEKTVEVQLYRANKFVRKLLREKWLPFFLLLFLG